MQCIRRAKNSKMIGNDVVEFSGGSEGDRKQSYRRDPFPSQEFARDLAARHLLRVVSLSSRPPLSR